MSNEAAERLMIHLGSWEATKLREALAIERRATVERIRAAYLSADVPDGVESYYRGIDTAAAALFAILDAEAAR